MSVDIHVIYTDYAEFGWGISSPQVPTLVAGSPTIDEALTRTEDMLEFAGVNLESANLIQHEQKYVQSPEGLEYLLRFVEPCTDGREALISRALWSVEHGTMDEDSQRMPTAPAGERIVIACERDDAVNWVLDQLAPGEGATVEWYAGNDAVYSVPIFDGDREFGKGAALEELGISRQDSIGDLIDAVIADEVSGLRQITKHKIVKTDA